MRPLSVTFLASLASLASALRPDSPTSAGSGFLTSDHLRAAPALPVGLYKRLKQQERLAAQPLRQQNSGLASGLGAAEQLVLGQHAAGTAEAVKPKYQDEWFEQRVSHLDEFPAEAGRETFGMRYWFDNGKFYKPGGPVIVLLAGETNGEGRIPFLDTGILNRLANATGGIG